MVINIFRLNDENKLVFFLTIRTVYILYWLITLIFFTYQFSSNYLSVFTLYIWFVIILKLTELHVSANQHDAIKQLFKELQRYVQDVNKQ